MVGAQRASVAENPKIPTHMNYKWIFVAACFFWVFMYGCARKWMIQAKAAKRKADEQHRNY